MEQIRDLIGLKNRKARNQESRSLRENLLRIVGISGFLTVVGVSIWQLPHFLEGNSDVWPQYANAFYDMLFYTAWTFAVLLLLTALTRTTSLKTLLAFWFLGVFAVHGLVVAVGMSFRDTLGVGGVAVWVAPITETAAVALVILLFYILATFRRSSHPTVSDGLLVGFATGAGLGFHEEMTYSRLMPIGPGAEYGSVGNLGQEIWWSYVFPLVGWQTHFNIRQFGNGLVGAFTLFHPGWGTLLGVGIGFAYVHRHYIFAWIVSLIAIAVVYFEHMSNNWRNINPEEQAEAPIVGDLFTAGDVHGSTELAIYTLLVAIAGAILADVVILRRTGGQIDDFPPIHSLLLSRDDESTMRSFTGTDGLGTIRRLRASDEYTRLRRSIIIGLYRVENTQKDPEILRPALVALRKKGREAKILASTGICLTVISTVLAFWLFDELTIPSSSASAQTLSCAACAPPHRFMDLIPTLMGAVGSGVAVISALRAGAPEAPSGLPEDAQAPGAFTVHSPERVEDPCSFGLK